MTTTYLIKNVSESTQSVVAIGEFWPWEVKEVSENKRNRLLRNPNFVDVTEAPELTEVTDAEEETTKKTTTRKK